MEIPAPLLGIALIMIILIAALFLVIMPTLDADKENYEK